MNSHRIRRTSAAAATLTLTAVLLAGCGADKPQVVAGTGGPGGTATAGATVDPNTPLGEPLAAADLPSWAEAALPGDADQGIVRPCDAPTGARDLQAGVRAAAMTTPTGITVYNQVADYDTSDPTNVIRDTITSALVACPTLDAGDENVMTRLLPSTKTNPAVGAEIVRTNTITGMRNVTVYWVELTGKGTVEVAVSATLGAVGESPLERFALDVLAAAQMKATGKAVPQVSAPALPVARTAAEEEAARLELEQNNAQVSDGGISGDATIIDEDEAVEVTDQLPTDWRDTEPVGGYIGGEGETGPGVITD